MTSCCSFCARTGCGHYRCCTGMRSLLLWRGWWRYAGCLGSYRRRDLPSPSASRSRPAPVLQSAYSSSPLSTTFTGLYSPRMTCLSITTSTFSRKTRFSGTRSASLCARRRETTRRWRTCYSLASRCWTTATCTHGSATGPCWNVYGARMRSTTFSLRSLPSFGRTSAKRLCSACWAGASWVVDRGRRDGRSGGEVSWRGRCLVRL